MATDKTTIAESLREIRWALSEISKAKLAPQEKPLTPEQEQLVRNFIDTSELLKVAAGLKHPSAKALKHGPPGNPQKHGPAGKTGTHGAPAKAFKHGALGNPLKHGPAGKTGTHGAPAKAIKNGPPAKPPSAKTGTKPDK